MTHFAHTSPTFNVNSICFKVNSSLLAMTLHYFLLGHLLKLFLPLVFSFGFRVVFYFIFVLYVKMWICFHKS